MIVALVASIVAVGTISSSASGTGTGLAEWALNAYYSNWRYVYGGCTPGTVDCSGLIYQCLYSAGINPDTNIIDHARVVYEYTSNYLGNDWQMGVAVSSAQPGDLVFYGGSSINHVAIYAGNGMIYDSWPGQGVTLRNIYSGGNILKIVRVF